MSAIGLVTVLYKSDEVLEGFFKSIALQAYKNYILYLVDNSVNETSTALIHKYLHQYAITSYRHIKEPENTGVAAGNNTGIHLALDDGCSHVLLLNNDIEMEQDFVFSRLMELSSQKGEKMVVPKIFYFDEKKIWMAGGYMDKWRALGVHYGMRKEDSPEYNKAKYISYAPTCFMLIDKDVFAKTGMMDEKYFAYYDDTDFVYRALKDGFKLYFEPSVSILHKVSSSAGENSPFYVYYSNRNKIYFIKKNLRGFFRYFSLIYMLLSRVIFYIRFDKERRKKLVLGMKDGFRMKVT